MAKRNSAKKLIVMVVVAVTLFMGLALGEDYLKIYLRRRDAQVTITGATTAIGKAIKRYNTTLVAAYAQDKPSLLADVATDRQITEVRLYMTYDQIEKKRKLITALKSLSIDKIARVKNKATAWTTETWENKYVDLNTKRESPAKVESYKVKYSLMKSGPDWLVVGLKAQNLQ